MTKTLLALAVIIWAASGCAPEFNPTPGPVSQFDRDSFECKTLAYQLTDLERQTIETLKREAEDKVYRSRPGGGAIVGPPGGYVPDYGFEQGVVSAKERRFYEECMRGRGYRNAW
jgi:hypothetical protein